MVALCQQSTDSLHINNIEPFEPKQSFPLTSKTKKDDLLHFVNTFIKKKKESTIDTKTNFMMPIHQIRDSIKKIAATSKAKTASKKEKNLTYRESSSSPH